MRHKNSQSAVILIALTSFLVSVVFGSNGVEAFYSLYISTGIVLSVLVFTIIRYIFRNKLHIVIKLMSIPPLLVWWLVMMSVIVLPVLDPPAGAVTELPNVEWWIVAGSVVSFLISRPLTQQRSLQKMLIGLVTGMFSIITMFMAFVGYFSADSTIRQIILVLAVNCVYIAQYIYTETDYVQKVHKSVNSRMNTRSDAYIYAITGAIALPFLLGLILIIALT